MGNDLPMYTPLHDANAHLAMASDGTYLGATLNNETNKLQGQARWIQVDPSDVINSQKTKAILLVAAGIAVGVLATVVVIRATPHIKKWWSLEMQPRLHRLWNSVRNKESNVVLEPVTVAPPVDVHAFSTELSVLVNEPGSVMNSREAQERYLAMIVALAFAAEQMRLLKDSQIADPKRLREIEKAAQQIQTPSALANLNRMLENDPSLVDQESREMFTAIFGGGVPSSVGYTPIKLERMAEAMSFTPLPLP